MAGTNPLAGRLRVLLDARMLIGGFGGVSRFVTRLIDHLSRIDTFHVIALCGDESPPLEGVESIRTSFSRSHRTPTKRLLWEERNLPGIIRRIQPDIYHATWNTGVPARCPVPTILTLHDLIPLHRPAEYFASWTQQHAYRYATRRALRRATHITTVSQYVADEVIGTYAIDSRKISVIPNGVDPPPFRTPTVSKGPEQSRARKEADESATTPQSPAHSVSAQHTPEHCFSPIPTVLDTNESRIRKRPPNDEPFVLYVGGHEPRKNVAGLLRAMRHCWQRFNLSLHLHLTGNIDDLDAAARIELNNFPDASNIIFLGRPNDIELAAEYRRATALLMLSIDEGFGLPVLEAQAHGCPVIAANRSSLPEVAGEAALLVNPHRPDEVAAAINQLCHDQSLRQRKIDQGHQRTAQFTWQNTAARFAKLYQSVIVEPRSQVVARPTPGGRTKVARDFSPW